MITLQPSADIHLAPQPTAGATLQLDTLSQDGAAEPTSVRDKYTFTSASPTIAAVSSAGVLTATAVGRTFLTVEHTPASGPTSSSIVARVWVHPRISNWWIGIHRASVHAGEADLLVSAYAQSWRGRGGLGTCAGVRQGRPEDARQL